MSDSARRVRDFTETLGRLEDERQAFAKRHGFAFKRPEHFRDCVVIRWKHRRRQDKDFIDHDRIDEYVAVALDVFRRFGPFNPEGIRFGLDVELAGAGIYSFSSWRSQVWAIPDCLPDVQAFVLARLPAWAHITRKPPSRPPGRTRTAPADPGI